MQNSIEETKKMLAYMTERIDYKEALEMALNRVAKGDLCFFYLNPCINVVDEKLLQLSEQFLAVHEPEYRELLSKELMIITEEVEVISKRLNTIVL